MQGVDLTKDQLKAKFGIGERLAVRVLALRKKDVEVTEAVLDETRRRPEIEALLLSSKLYELAGKLDGRSFRSAFPRAGGLTVVMQDDRRILALQEEAEAGLATRPAESLNASPARFAFTSTEIEQLKLTILTSVEAKAKIEAIRKLAYASVEAKDKGVIYLRALTDPDGAVRKEAVGALQIMGLSRDLAECLAAASDAAVAQKRLALEKLDALLPRAPSGEKHIALSAIAAALQYETDKDIVGMLLLSLRHFADLLPKNRESLAFLVKTFLKVLTDHFQPAAGNLIRLFDEIGSTFDEEASRVIWNEIQSVGDPKLKALFLSVIGRLKIGADLREQLARTVAQVLATTFGEEAETRQILEVGKSLGADQVRAYLEVVPLVKDDHLPHFLATLDFVTNADAIPDDLVRKVGQLYLKSLESKGKHIRATILECSLCHSRRMPSELKQRLAADFILNLHLYKMPRLIDLTVATLARMGFDAVEPLLAAAAKSPYDVERVTALQLIGEICENCERPREELEGVLKTLKKFETDKDFPKGALAICSARLSINPAMSPQMSEALFRSFRSSLGRVDYNIDLIVALGHLGASKNVDSKETCDLMLEMLTSLEGTLPDPKLEEKQTVDGPRIYIGKQVMAYTDFVPSVLKSVRMIYASGKLTRRVQELAIAKLVRRCDDLADFREIWAPGNLVDLAQTLGEMARFPGTPEAGRRRILKGLVGQLKNLSIARVVSDTLIFEEDDSDEYLDVLGRFIQGLFKLLSHPDYQQLEDRRQIILALGRVCGHRRLAGTKRESDRVRERILELLLEHSSPTFRESHRILARVERSKHMPPALRKRIQAAIQR